MTPSQKIKLAFCARSLLTTETKLREQILSSGLERVYRGILDGSVYPLPPAPSKASKTKNRKR